MTLSPENQAKIQSITRGDVAKTLSSLQPFFHQDRWVGPRNRYASNTISKIKSEMDAGSLNAPKQLAQYIAASSVLHSADGWSFLGAAITSLLRGDPHRTRHLAYYAELRAAMSLLSAFGIGVFKNTHFVIDAPDSATALPKGRGTHNFVWECIEHFGSQNDLGELFASIIRPYGSNLGGWLTPIGGTGTIAPQAREWFLQWGHDLQMPWKDHDARNESSYRPDGIPTGWYVNAPEVLKFVQDLWLALEPAPSSRFDQIDRHILRIAIERSHRAQYGKSRSKKHPRLDDFVTQVVDNQSFTAKVAQTWTDFLLRRVSPDDHALLVASRKLPQCRDGSELAIVARAALLLRAASGAALHLFDNAGIGIESTNFWRDGLGIGRGLWETAGGDPMDLWADVEPLLQDIATFQEIVAPADQTFFRMGTDLGRAISGLGMAERVAVWSMSS